MSMFHIFIGSMENCCEVSIMRIMILVFFVFFDGKGSARWRLLEIIIDLPFGFPINNIISLERGPPVGDF